MEPTKVTIKKLEQVTDLLKEADESSIGTYLFKGLRIQISKYRASGSERFARLYHRRREQGLCVVCGAKVTKKNPRTKKAYRLCEEHRDKIDKRAK
ncbi:MAG: hypothetical protein JXR70_06270 [Spirochaetales bacterium]|nr:hypothetical protein [Spirochaetales bacterium]